MQHSNLDMTFPALSARADAVKVLDSVTDYLENDDMREVTVFLRHDMSESLRYGEWYNTLVGKEVIGVALCDLDDPQAAVEVLTRDEAVAMFGWKRVERWEEVE